ncbi:MAG: hypothetical protein JW836_01985 [Deltaproteobacteria bacterium]|nr:hypothetical protein [Deltaproteobacteria bacterium]
MRHIGYVKTIIVVVFVFFVASAAFAGNPKSKPFLPDIPHMWTEITPGPTEFMGRELNPTCSGAPGTDPTFKFFVKGGPVNNLVVFFDGGGACWDTMNCIYYLTYSPEADETVEDQSQVNGIFDFSNPANPFIDWNFVFIPYCTGDIHWGSADKTYPGYYGEDSYTIHHRGFDNFLVVLKWIIEHFEKPQKIFVTGSSAGSYGALMGFPYIQEAYPKSMASMLGDAGFGVVTQDFQDVQIYNWGFEGNLPGWIPGFERPFSDYSIAEMYQMIGRYYTHRKIGQFTTAWDGTQAFFYNVMINTGDPLEWGNFRPAWCDWHEQMLENAYVAAEAPNYRYYVAAGTYHTILAYPEFYEEDSAGVPFVDWIKAMVENQGGTKGHGAMPWTNSECFDCEAPMPCP